LLARIRVKALPHRKVFFTARSGLQKIGKAFEKAFKHSARFLESGDSTAQVPREKRPGWDAKEGFCAQTGFKTLPAAGVRAAS
jgi:hypothetical protein